MIRPSNSTPAPGHECPDAEQLDALLLHCLRTQATPGPDPLSAAELDEVMARLRARGAFGDGADLSASPMPRPPRRATVATRGRSLRQLAALLMPPPARRGGSAAGLGLALPLVAVLGALLVLVWPDPPVSPQPGAEPWQPKAGALSVAPQSRAIAPAQWLPSRHPASDAARLAGELTEAGASVSVRADGRDRIVQFSAPVAASGSVGPVLSAWGLAPAAAGPQEVRLTHMPE